ncbi:MAG: tetratricopeptide repeat protein, partial [Kiritimatiellae bacterium]|nr:tetratricopeptide repeat protein [Kiritimatiellia bacterium]
RANKVRTEDAELRDDLSFKLKELGLLDFLKKWFKSDPDIMEKVAVVGWPDFWMWANCRPVPNGLFFGGVKDEKSVDGLKLKADFEAFWKKIEPILVSDRRKGSRAIREVGDPIEKQRLELRRHCGLIANNLGVLLQNLGHDAEAYDMYELVLGTIDSDNVCALLNVYEMFRAGTKKELAARRQEVEQQLKDLVADQSRRYNLRPLSGYYGYIRSPEIFRKLGLNWARSGEMGYAMEFLKSADEIFAAAEPSEALLHEVASIYAQSGQTMKAREVYEKTLEKDAANHEALMGLWLLSVREGAFDKAKEYLARAAQVPTKEGVVRMDAALLHMMNNRLDEAREELARITYLYPNSIQGWMLLAGVVLQQADEVKDDKKRLEILAQIDNEILPKMEKIASSSHDFRVQMLRALVLMRKGNDEDSLKKARSALEIVWMGRADTSVGAMVLNLDYRLLDRQSAERHALQILRLDEGHPYANWVMGSIRMAEGKMPEAERYLRYSTRAVRPPAAAQNDLAELLRKSGCLEEAEKFARAGTQNDPRLYVVWETLCATLLDQGKNLEEAEQCILKAIELSKDADIRMQLTLARVQIAKGDVVKARGTLRKLGARSDELSEGDRAVFEKLQQKALK